jgi:hypothetical protein
MTGVDANNEAAPAQFLLEGAGRSIGSHDAIHAGGHEPGDGFARAFQAG